MTERNRGWIFVLNNYTEDDVVEVNKIKCEYLVYGREVAPTTGTPHLQGYVYFQNAKSFSAVRKMFPNRIHIEKQIASIEDASNYCKKEGKFTEIGTKPQQGKRNDLQNIKSLVEQGKSMTDILETATNLQSVRVAEVLLKYKEQKRNWKPEVIWIYGRSGAGKTKHAYEIMPNAYRKSNSTGRWWDGYDAHKDVIIDDVKDDSREYYSVLLELLDRYETRIETKGGTRQFLARRIVITSIQDPRTLYSRYEEATEIIRRIDNLVELE